mgnify:CR=1 FL=1
MTPAAGLRIVLAQYNAVGSLQMIDGTNVLAVQAHHFHVLLNVKTTRVSYGSLAARPSPQPAPINFVDRASAPLALPEIIGSDGTRKFCDGL